MRLFPHLDAAIYWLCFERLKSHLQEISSFFTHTSAKIENHYKIFDEFYKCKKFEESIPPLVSSR